MVSVSDFYPSSPTTNSNYNYNYQSNCENTTSKLSSQHQVWVRFWQLLCMCLVRCSLRLNSCPHSEQMNSFLKACTFMWLRNSDRVWNPLPHCSHIKRERPVWEVTCLSNFTFSQKRSSQNSHWYCLSVACSFKMWRRSVGAQAKRWLQNSQA